MGKMVIVKSKICNNVTRNYVLLQSCYTLEPLPSASHSVFVTM